MQGYNFRKKEGIHAIHFIIIFGNNISSIFGIFIILALSFAKLDTIERALNI